MQNKNEFKERLVKMANIEKKDNTTITNKDTMKKIGDNARKVIDIIKHGEKENGR